MSTWFTTQIVVWPGSGDTGAVPLTTECAVITVQCCTVVILYDHTRQPVLWWLVRRDNRTFHVDKVWLRQHQQLLSRERGSEFRQTSSSENYEAALLLFHPEKHCFQSCLVIIRLVLERRSRGQRVNQTSDVKGLESVQIRDKNEFT